MRNLSHEKICICALNRIFGFEPATAHSLVDHLGSASAVFALSKNDLHEILGPHSKYYHLISEAELERSRDELAGLNPDEYDFITMDSPDYPTLLKECPDAPLGLYIRSRTASDDIFSGRDLISVVGTRDISLYGREWCAKLVSAIADAGAKPLIVSGLALGVDITAHLCALDCGVPTVGVMATGIDDVYPYRHSGYARRIAETPGCALITDYPRGTAPVAVNFLRRNRIIAGMSKATILVESKTKGGGMMTANLAFSYNREVFALPGRIDDVRSGGCNHLIRAKVAEPIEDCISLIRSLGMDTDAPRARRIPLKERVREFYSGKMPAGRISLIVEVAKQIDTHRGITPDELSVRTGFQYTDIAALACLLESDGFISMDLLQRCAANVPKTRKEN